MGIKQISNRKWMIDYSLRDENNKQHRIQRTVYGTYDIATSEYHRIKEIILKRAVYNQEISLKPLTMEEMGTLYLRHSKTMGCRMEGIERNVEYAVQFFGKNTKVTNLKPTQLIEYRQWHKKRNPKIQESTINRAMAYLRAMVNKAVDFEWGGLQNSPFRKYPTTHEEIKQQTFISESDLDALIENAYPTLQEVIYCLLYTGSRISEVLSMTWDQVDFNRMNITMITKDTKRKGREIQKPIAEEFLPLLKRMYIDNQKIGSRYLFPHPDDPSVHIKSVRRSWMTACKRAGLVGITPHKIRHTFCSYLVMDTGGDMKVVSELVGHTNPTITSEYYAHLSNQYRNDAINLIGKRFPLKKILLEPNHYKINSVPEDSEDLNL